jgi:hypothetical protein
MDVMGNEIKMDIGQTVDMTWTIKAVDKDGQAKMTQTMDRVRFTMDTPMGKVEFDSKENKEPDGPIGKIVGPILKAMAGAEFTLTMSPQGETSELKVPKSLMDAIKNTPGAANLGSMFSEEGFKRMSEQAGLVLPKEAVAKGKSWNKTFELKMPFGKMKGTNKFAYQGPVTRGDQKLEEFALSQEVNIEADPGAPATLKVKDQNAKGKAYFDAAAGRLVETGLTQNMNMEIMAGGQMMVQRIKQTISLKLAGTSK